MKYLYNIYLHFSIHYWLSNSNRTVSYKAFYKDKHNSHFSKIPRAIYPSEKKKTTFFVYKNIIY